MAIAIHGRVSPVSLSHEAPLEVLRQHPEAVLELLRIAGRPKPPKLEVEVLDSELTEAIPSVRRARTERSPTRRIYLSLLHGTARGPLRGTLEKLLEAYGMGALEILFNDGKAEGLAVGKAEGKAEGLAVGKAEGLAVGKAEGEALALLKVLRARGLDVDAAAEARILATRDLALFDRWLERALVAGSVDEVLAQG